MGRCNWPHGGVRGRAYGRKQCPFFLAGTDDVAPAMRRQALPSLQV